VAILEVDVAVLDTFCLAVPPNVYNRLAAAFGMRVGFCSKVPLRLLLASAMARWRLGLDEAAPRGLGDRERVSGVGFPRLRPNQTSALVGLHYTPSKHALGHSACACYDLSVRSHVSLDATSQQQNSN
jgi:hypothetical protein